MNLQNLKPQKQFDSLKTSQTKLPNDNLIINLDRDIIFNDGTESGFTVISSGFTISLYIYTPEVGHHGTATMHRWIYKGDETQADIFEKLYTSTKETLIIIGPEPAIQAYPKLIFGTMPDKINEQAFRQKKKSMTKFRCV